MIPYLLLSFAVVAIVLLRITQPPWLKSGAAVAVVYWAAALSAATLWRGIPDPGVAASLVSLAVAIALVGVALIIALGREAPFSRRTLAFAGGSLVLFVGAFALRWWLPEHTLIHENRHGFWVDLGRSDVMTMNQRGAVSSHLLLARLLHQLYPDPDSVFLSTALWSSLAVVGIFWLARLAFDSAVAGWTCASLLLLQPVAILMATTEEYMSTAAGCALVGMALAFRGARSRAPFTLMAGTGFIVLAASVRDVALPLVALLPFAVMAATRRWTPRPVEWLAYAIAGLLCVPRALVFLQAYLEQGSGLGFVGLPDFLFVTSPEGVWQLNSRWVGWQTPFVPRWVTLLALTGTMALLLWSLLKRDLWVAVAVVGAIVVAYVSAMVVRDGWFPTHLRHQLVLCALLLLPAGWLVGTISRIAGEKLGRWALAPFLLLPFTAGALSLSSGGGYRVDAPMIAEHRFFAEHATRIPINARLIRLRVPEGNGAALPHYSEWIAKRVRGVELIEPQRFIAEARLAGREDAWLLIDRLCFVDWECFEDPRRVNAETGRCVDVEGAKRSPRVSSPYGEIHPLCSEVLGAVAWEEVARETIPPGRGRHYTNYDLPPLGDQQEVVVLRWTPSKQVATGRDAE